jgi:hypothetical protein
MTPSEELAVSQRFSTRNDPAIHTPPPGSESHAKNETMAKVEDVVQKWSGNEPAQPTLKSTVSFHLKSRANPATASRQSRATRARLGIDAEVCDWQIAHHWPITCSGQSPQPLNILSQQGVTHRAQPACTLAARGCANPLTLLRLLYYTQIGPR